MTVPAGNVSLTLRSRLADLQPALRRLAETVLADPAGVAAMTIGELARTAECSEATVVRFAHELGYSGYREMRFKLHEEAVAAQSRGTADRYAGDIDPTDDLDAVVGKIASADSRAVQDTAHGIDLGQLEAIALALSRARRVVTVGAGASGLAATDLQQKLSRVGLFAAMYADAHESLASIALLGEGDVVIAVSHSGRTVEPVRALRVARDAGALTVAVTGAAGGPLAALADHVLLTTAVESVFRSGATASRIAQLTVVDCVFVAVAQRLPGLGAEALRRTRAAVEDLHPR